MAQSSTTIELPQAAAAPPRRRPWALWSVGLFVAVVVVVVCKMLHVVAGTNLHTVISGKIYRGAQPNPAAIHTLVKQHGIRTILNLRGTCFPQEWYLEEAKTAQELGLALEDLTFSAGRWPSRHELRHLVETLDRAEYPLFMHCRQGADRTGMASVIAQVLVGDVPYAEARRQLGMRYGHAPVGHPTILDCFFDRYEDWLKQSGREHDAAAFRHWLLEEYRGGQCQGVIEEATPLQTAWRVGDPISFRVRVHNTSQEPWQFKPTRTAGMHLGFQLWDSAGRAVAGGRAGLFERTVLPGERLTVTLVAPPVKTAGRYRLMVDMVEENHCWFFQTGSEPWEEAIDVRD